MSFIRPIGNRLLAALVVAVVLLTVVHGWAADRPASQVSIAATARRPAYDTLAFAGQFTRQQIVRFSWQDGRLSAKWTGVITAPEPRRIDLGETDAEWMVHTPSAPKDNPTLTGRWFLSRRELRPSADGRYWLVCLYGFMDDPGNVQILATSENALTGIDDVFNVLFTQAKGKLGVEFWGRKDGQAMTPFTASAASLTQLARQDPKLVEQYLAPALDRITGLKANGWAPAN